MGHIFISYSHADSDYAHRLADSLQAEGLDVWIDARIDYGSQWPLEIQRHLDSCDAFILVMSPRSFASEWVQSELQRAKRKRKPIFPLLLEGEEPWLSVESTQYYDVRGDTLPDARFYSALRRVVSPAQGVAVQMPVSDARTSPKKRTAGSAPRIRTEILIAIIGAAATLLAAAIPLIWSSLTTRQAPSPTEQAGSFTPAAEFTQSPAAPGESTDEPSIPPAPDDIEMVLIPAGEFTMGTDDSPDALERCQQENEACDVSWLEEEQPAHAVYLDAFYMDLYEVTNVMYADCVNKGVCEPPTYAGSATRTRYYGDPEFDHYPVIFVDWNMANTYCGWRGARLPTEAEWEKAARGSDARVYPWGNELDSAYLNYGDNLGDTTEAGDYDGGRSSYGLYDMAGNVWEWVSDWYSYTYYQESPYQNPPGPSSGDERVVRGGSWYDSAYLVRTSVRNKFPPDFVDNNFGFRCARDAQ